MECPHVSLLECCIYVSVCPLDLKVCSDRYFTRLGAINWDNNNAKYIHGISATCKKGQIKKKKKTSIGHLGKCSDTFNTAQEDQQLPLTCLC